MSPGGNSRRDTELIPREIRTARNQVIVSIYQNCFNIFYISLQRYFQIPETFK